MERSYVIDYYHIDRGIIDTERLRSKDEMPELLDFVRISDEFHQVIEIHHMYDADNNRMHCILKIQEIPEESNTIIGDLFEYVDDMVETPINEDDIPIDRSEFAGAEFIFRK